MNGFQIYGTGERTTALNLRDGKLRMWSRDPGSSYQHGDDPLYLSQRFPKGYLVFYENSFGFIDRTVERVASQLYSHAGDGHGKYRLERFRWMRRTDVLDLRREQEGSVQPAPHPLQIFLHGGKAESVSADSQPSRAEAGGGLLSCDFNAAQFRLAGGRE